MVLHMLDLRVALLLQIFPPQFKLNHSEENLVKCEYLSLDEVTTNTK